MKLGEQVRFAYDLFHNKGLSGGGGEVRFSLSDAYAHARACTYFSTYEGFGNAFLEAIYYRKPIVMSCYDIYKVDIRPKGFEVIEFEDYITKDTVRRTRSLLTNPDQVEKMVTHNYEVASHHYSYRNLEILLDALVSLSLGTF